MTDNIAIKVKNVTKVYHLYDKPQDRFKEALHPFRKSYHHDFFATNDISFEIKKGETVGIIGKNGAGKSTLLKMITGVLTPTSGDIQVNGKIASLLELGAGFNPEMTGLENIYLNGTLMGFSQQEMEPKIEAILEFADIGEFIHQPVKVYSSGMFARLAFSVAINVEPDILIVDEVLSVGDMRFQQKSIRKMKAFEKKGITILFVSHDINIINNFCSRALWLKGGEILKEGKSSDVTKDYFSYMSYGEVSEVIDNEKKEHEMQTSSEQIDKFQSFGRKEVKIESASFINMDTNKKVFSLSGGENVLVTLELLTKKEILDLIIGIEFKNKQGTIVFGMNNLMYQKKFSPIVENSVTKYQLSFLFPYLSTGEYSASLAIAEGIIESHIQQHWVHDLFVFTVNSDANKKINSIFYIKDENVNFKEYI